MTKMAKLVVLRMTTEEAHKAGVREVSIEAFKGLIDLLGATISREEVLEEIILEKTGWDRQLLALEENKKINERLENIEKEENDEIEDVLSLIEILRKL